MARDAARAKAARRAAGIDLSAARTDSNAGVALLHVFWIWNSQGRRRGATAPCVGGLLQLHKLARIVIISLANGSALIFSELLHLRHCSLAAYKVGSGFFFQPGAIGVEVSAMNPVNATALYISASRLVLNYDPGDPKAFTEINRLLPYFRQSLSCCVCGETLFKILFLRFFVFKAFWAVVM